MKYSGQSRSTSLKSCQPILFFKTVYQSIFLSAAREVTFSGKVSAQAMKKLPSSSGTSSIPHFFAKASRFASAAARLSSAGGSAISRRNASFTTAFAASAGSTAQLRLFRTVSPRVRSIADMILPSAKRVTFLSVMRSAKNFSSSVPSRARARRMTEFPPPEPSSRATARNSSCRSGSSS